MSILIADFSSGVRLARRFGFGPIGLAAVVLVAVAAFLASQFSGRQPATVALDTGLSVMRLILPLVGILLLQELVSREFDRRYYLLSMTYPRPRHWLLLGRLAALALLMALLLAACGAALAAVAGRASQGYEQATPIALGMPYWITLAFLVLDVCVVVAFGTLLAVSASTPSLVLIGTLGFMLVARSFSSIVALLQRESWLVTDAQTYQASLGVLGHLLPDLAALDVRPIALYDDMAFLPAQWPWHVASALAYMVALLALAVWVLSRKRFA